MQEYTIEKNCFVGREGYKKTLDPKCTMTKELLHNGYLKAIEQPKKETKKKAAKK